MFRRPTSRGTLDVSLNIILSNFYLQISIEMATKKITSEFDNFFYESLFNNLIDGLAYCQMIFDRHQTPVDFIYVRVNKAFETLTGLKGVEGKKITDVIPGINKSNPELFEVYGRVSLIGGADKFETYVAPLARWFLVSVYSPKKNFFVAVFENITDRKKIEKDLEDARTAARNVSEDIQSQAEILAKTNAKDEAMLASIGDGMVIVGPVGRIILINQSAQHLLGLAKEELVGKLFSSVIVIEDEKGREIPFNMRPMTRTLAASISTAKAKKSDENTIVASGVYYRRGNKTRFPVAITVAPVVLENRVIGAIEIFRDITKEKDIDRVKTEFISIASHQLRTPLTTISWYSEMLIAGDTGNIGILQKKYLGEVRHGIKRMVELVNALLSVARLELGTFATDPKPTDVALVVQNVISELKTQIDEKKIACSFVCQKNMPVIYTDQKLLRMVAQNLLSNAVKYTGEKGKVSLFLSADKKDVLLRISDTGCGIPKHQQDKIFTKLFRADNAREKDTEGTGLGLYIVKSIIGQFGGNVRFESEENKGTTFFVTFPLEGMEKPTKYL